MGCAGYICPKKVAQAREWLNSTRAAWIANGNGQHFDCSAQIFDRGLRFLDLFESQLAELDASAAQRIRHTGFAKRNMQCRLFCLQVWHQCMVLFHDQMKERLKYWETEIKNLEDLVLNSDVLRNRMAGMLRDYRWAGVFSQTIRDVSSVRPQSEQERLLQRDIQAIWQRGVQLFKSIQAAYGRRNLHLSSVALRLHCSALFAAAAEREIFSVHCGHVDMRNPLAAVLAELRYLAKGHLASIILAYKQFCQCEAQYLIQIDRTLGFNHFCFVENAMNVINLNARFQDRLAFLEAALERHKNVDSSDPADVRAIELPEAADQAAQFAATARTHLRTVRREAAYVSAMMSAYLEVQDAALLKIPVGSVRHLFLEDEMFAATVSAMQTARLLLQLVHCRAQRLTSLKFRADDLDFKGAAKRASRVCSVWSETTQVLAINVASSAKETNKQVFLEVLELLQLCKRSHSIVAELHGLFSIRGLPLWSDVVTGSSAAVWYRKCQELMRRVLTSVIKVHTPPSLGTSEIQALSQLIGHSHTTTEKLRSLTVKDFVKEVIQNVFTNAQVFRRIFISSDDQML
eukprot:Gregarina_sp_Pseudo_9__5549@NODE_738_length_2294_cov_5_283370_g694_i0_p1_GENE_NODE_738_length_2294_cov_5_283370_g694_i0NODE_738_length_2294_cov_5_283370_g694_i0_p1_ORF_typecomplete_len593_score90_79_NODE_738_length_2294_cov_5_283370_g694_i05142235